jgi:antitoxin VapB
MGEERHVRLFRNGRSQAVRIPRDFELPGDEAIIRKDGDKLVIEPVRKKRSLSELLEEMKTWEPLGPDDQFPEIEDLPARPDRIDTRKL